MALPAPTDAPSVDGTESAGKEGSHLYDGTVTTCRLPGGKLKGR
jgi:hypothetical protein